jgi:nucleotide-binding universal stress UspA family protein
MKPFSKILVPVDFSNHSAEAVRYAADLSRRYEASVTLAHIYQPVAYALPEGYVLYTVAQLASMMSEFEKQLEAAKAHAQAAGALSVDTKVLQGVVSSEIVSFAERSDHDLIVMGTHGRTGLKHALLGSVAEKVVRKAPCPVLTVRSTEKA